MLGTSHRQAPVKNLVGAVREGLAELFSLPDGYEVVLGNGGSTAFWDIAAFGLVRERAQHLSFGEFSSKFASVTSNAPVPRRPDRSIKAEPGTPRRPARRGRRRRLRLAAQRDLDRRDGPGPAGRRAPTTTRSCSSTPPPAPAACPSTSPRPTSTTSRPQKCFASDGGLWLAAFSPAALARVEEIAASGRWVPDFFGLPTAIDNSPQEPDLQHPGGRARWPCWPTSSSWINGQGGLDWAVTRTADSPRAGSTTGPSRRRTRPPYVADPAHRSQVVGTIDFDDDVDAAAVAKTLRANGVVDVEPYRKLGRNQLRVAMFPAVDPDDVAALTACIDHVVGQG